MNPKQLDVYGIPNCNTVKKALDWLKKHNVDFVFHDFKKEPPTEVQLRKWETAFGTKLVNRKGPTFRKISSGFDDLPKVEQRKQLMRFSSALKRPIIEKADKPLLIGYEDSQYSEILG